MNLHTLSARAAAAMVATIAGAASWEHIASVALSAGERGWVAYSLPAAIDGLIVVGVAAMLEDRQSGARSRWRARLAVVTGVVATLAANVASAEPTWTARLVAVAAPVSFLLSVEVLTRAGRPVQPVPPEPTDDPPSATENAPQRPARAPGSAKPRTRRSAAQRVQAARSRHPAETQQQLATRLRVSLATVQRHDPGRADASGPDGPEHDRVPVLAGEQTSAGGSGGEQERS